LRALFGRKIEYIVDLIDIIRTWILICGNGGNFFNNTVISMVL